ncbi:hypothetical protein [Cerasicoccus maritimus]|uniref:hypothetical protein n=1 Tax=Cerasicoccus maritimus TaxID=490089 RepID=UPI002852BE3A|nr:hypothetical protein [Cerasicoccus maritimus]
MLINNPLHGSILSTALTLVLSGAFTSSQAATVFEFGPSASYVDSDTSFERTASESGSGPYIFENAFSDTTALSPSSGYSGPKVYGGYIFTSSDIDSGFSNQAVRNNYSNLGSNDTLWLQTFRSLGWGSGTFSFAAVYLFKQEEFNAGFETGNVGVDGFSISFYQNSSGSPADKFSPVGRWMVEIDGVYYLSEATISGGNGVGNTISISGSELSSTQWAVYSPESSILFDAGSATFETISLSGVTAVGVNFSDDSFTGDASGSSVVSFGVSEFSVTGTTIPEANSFMLILPAVFLVGIRCFSRKHRRGGA